jgi:hypothetical protein
MQPDPGVIPPSPPSPAEILADPEFQALPIIERQKVMQQIDPNFAGLPEEEQNKVLDRKIPPKPLHGPWDNYKRPKADWSPVVSFWEQRSAVALIPPAILYLFSFGVVPWIARGFRSTQV